MPNYDYECTSCNKVMEIFQQMSDAPLEKCPECGGEKITRLIAGGLGVIFKGSGFYVTDSKNTQSGKKAKTEAAPASESCNTCPAQCPSASK